MWYTPVYHMISTSFPAVYRWYTYGKINMVMYTCIPRVYQMAFSIWFLCVQSHFKSSCILSICDVIWLFHVYTRCNTCGYGHVHMYSTCIPDGISIMVFTWSKPPVFHVYKSTCSPHVQNQKISLCCCGLALFPNTFFYILRRPSVSNSYFWDDSTFLD